MANAADFVITDFGATSGGGDDRTAIQTAIFAASPGDRVIIPEGTFHLSGPVFPTTGITISGLGRDLSTLEYMGSSTTSEVIRIDGSSRNNVTLENFTVDGTGTQSNGTSPARAMNGILLQNTSGHVIRNMRVRDITQVQTDFSGGSNSGIRFASGVSNSLIEGNEIRNIGVDAIRGTAIRGNNSPSNKVVNNLIQDVGRTGIHFAHSSNMVVQRNTVIDSGLYDGPTSVQWAGDGLSIELFGGSSNSVVEDNQVDRWISMASASKTAVRRNKIITPAYRTEIETAGLELASGDDNIFTDNFVGPGARMSLLVVANNNETVERVFLGRNTFSEGSGRNAQIHANAGTPVHRLYFYDNKFINSQATSDDPSFTYAGVRLLSGGPGLDEGVREIVFEANEVSGNNGHAFRIGGSNHSELVFYENVVTQNTGDAFHGTKVFPSVHFDSNNTVENNGGSEATPTDTGFDNTAPLAMILSDSIVSVGSPIDFGMAYSDDNSTMPDDILWDFDEGVPVLDLAPTQNFERAGMHQVTLVVWDNDGRAARHTVEVDVLADFDQDTDVDGQDFLAWQRDDSPLQSNLHEWKSDYGSSLPIGQLTGVPEPQTLVMLVAFITICRIKRSRWHGQVT
ncbi:MAG: right-handed parallel beta-helix repeat-containing protein [Lacipirellulaceae bacterium]